jgi:hypothetical protein
MLLVNNTNGLGAQETGDTAESATEAAWHHQLEVQ